MFKFISPRLFLYFLNCHRQQQNHLIRLHPSTMQSLPDGEQNYIDFKLYISFKTASSPSKLYCTRSNSVQMPPYVRYVMHPRAEIEQMILTLSPPTARTSSSDKSSSAFERNFFFLFAFLACLSAIFKMSHVVQITCYVIITKYTIN